MMKMNRFALLILLLALLATAAFLGRPTAPVAAEISAVPTAMPYFIKNLEPHWDNSSNIAFNGFFLFVTDDGVHGKELWRSDGTEAGTVLVKDFSPDTDSAPPTGFTIINNTLFLLANDGTGGDTYGLWRSDGTTAGTTLLKGGLEDPYSWYIQHPTLFLFTDYTAEHGVELWRSDGTAEGTVMVKDINPGPDSSDANPIAQHGQILYFSATTPEAGNELWRTDGTAAGTYLVKDIFPGETDSYAGPGIVFNDILYFAATNGGDHTLWQSDGTAEGTTEMLNTLIEPSNFTILGDKFFFTPFHPDYGRELWVSDGTIAGTNLVKDIRLGTVGSSPSQFNVLNDKLYLNANNDANGFELWTSDGTEAGTFLVKDIYPGAMTGILGGIVSGHGRLYIAANDGLNGLEVWQSDGTEAGTIRITDINPGLGDSNPANMRIVGDRLFFSASNGSSTGLWAAADPQEGPAFVVNNLTDANNGACTLGSCSLREAILAANANPGADTITFQADLGGVIHLDSSLPIIVDPLTISGPGVGYIILNGALVQFNSMIRVDTGGSLTISGLTIAEGGSTNNNINVGGAISSTPPITITNVRFNNNKAIHGGALAAYGNATLTNVEFSNNEAQQQGGAIASYNGTVNIYEGYFAGNSTQDGGGAIYTQANFLNIFDSYFESNSAVGNGGAIHAFATLNLQRSQLVWNEAMVNGGAIYLTTQGNSAFHNSLFVGNTAGGTGNVLYIDGNNLSVTHDFAHNTVAAEEQQAGVAIDMVANAGINVTNNIIANQNIAIRRVLGTVNEDYNLFYDNVTNQSGITGGANSLIGDPRFISAENGLYGLLLDSPAIDAGLASAVNVDYSDEPRPQGTAPDMGFDEVAQTAVTGPGGYAIGNTGVSITVTQAGDLANVQLIWVPLDHPSYDEESEENHPASTGGYWTIVGLNSNGQTATGFSLTLTLPYDSYDPNPTVCRWDGQTWDCARSGLNSTHVWRHNVTAFSDWAIGEWDGTAAGHAIYLPLITR